MPEYPDCRDLKEKKKRLISLVLVCFVEYFVNLILHNRNITKLTEFWVYSHVMVINMRIALVLTHVLWLRNTSKLLKYLSAINCRILKKPTAINYREKPRQLTTRKMKIQNFHPNIIFFFVATASGGNKLRTSSMNFLNEDLPWIFSTINPKRVFYVKFKSLPLQHILV